MLKLPVVILVSVLAILAVTWTLTDVVGWLPPSALQMLPGILGVVVAVEVAAFVLRRRRK